MGNDPTDSPQVLHVSDGVWARQAVDNMGWADLGGSAVIVDALEQRRLKDDVFAALDETLGDTPVRHVLNTHTHGDHTALNRALVKRYKADVVNARTGDLGEDGRWFEGQRGRALLLPTPGCHTDEDCCVWIEPDRVLFVGDVFGWGLVPPNGALAPGQAEHILRTYERLIDFGAETVVPGHGPVCSTAELQRWTDYFRWLIDEAKAGVAAGQSDSHIRRRVPPPDDMHSWWRFLDWKHDDAVDKTLHAAKRGAL